MSQTIAEKILSEKVGRDVTPGEIVKVEYDLVASHDFSTPAVASILEEWDVDDIADPDRVAIIPDHMIPSHDEVSQHNYTVSKQFAETHGIETFYPQRETGLMHVVLHEDGLVKPGDVVIGADSHTPTCGAIGAFATGVGFTDVAFAIEKGWTWFRVPESIRFEYSGEPDEWVRGKDIVLHTLGEIGIDGAVYKAMEFAGPLIAELPLDDRFSIANMAIEGGGMVGLFEPDAKTDRYLAGRIESEYRHYAADDGASYDETYHFDCDDLEPQVAIPSNPGNVKPVTEVAGIEVDQAVVGSCTNSREEDLKLAARVLRDNRIHDDVRLIITPGSRSIQKTAFEEGWMEIFHDAGANMGSPGCGACFGQHIGVLDENEVAIATTNRNFVGRMGANSSEVYLANPAVAAASAVTGYITHPEEVM